MEKAVRKDSKVKDKPGVIIATLENIEQRSEILKNKNKLKDSTKHKNIYIQADVCYEQRIASQNLRTILKELGKDNVLAVHVNSTRDHWWHSNSIGASPGLRYFYCILECKLSIL